ncbi:hypothetical protein CN296_20930 [Bacillus cereus]|nr:hypothetical protein CN296_20930 [Bacillus cereus]
MANISSFIRNIQNAMFGKDVRGSLADGLHAVNKETEVSTKLSHETKQNQDHLETRWNTVVAGTTNGSEVIDLRVDAKGFVHTNAKVRADSDFKENATKIDLLKTNKATQLDTVLSLKKYNATIGEIIETRGYYVVGDKGHGKYIIVSAGKPDDGFIIALDNGLYAKLVHNGTIYARQYGAKLDDATDDTVRLNAFFKMFGEAKLVINDGIAVTTNPLIVKGKWREDDPTGKYNNSLRKLVFDNATIRYTGEPGKCCIMFWRHFTSFIEGLAISRTSNKCYVDLTMMWHSEFKNFDIPMLCINKDTSIITEPIETKSVHTMKFGRGYIYNYNLRMDTGGSYVNSIHFYDVNFFSNLTSYCVEFYGNTSFQNITFNKCDMSYATRSIFYINELVAHSCSIKMDSCYLDSSIPYVEDSMFKGFALSVNGTIEASLNSSTQNLLYTTDYLKHYRTASFGADPDTIPTANLNLCKNGDFFCTNPDATPGWIGNNPNVKFNFKAGNSSLSGNILTATFLNNTTTYFYGIDAPITSPYTVGMRIKLISGKGRLQIGFAGFYRYLDLDNILIGQEFVLSSSGFGNAIKNEGDALSFSVTLQNKGAENVVIEISEAFIVPGVQTRLLLPLHPKAQVFRKKSGVYSYDGDNSVTSKKIAHLLYAIPSNYTVQAASVDAGNAGIKYVTADSTHITVYLNSPPIAGKDNVKLTWKAEV